MRQVHQRRDAGTHANTQTLTEQQNKGWHAHTHISAETQARRHTHISAETRAHTQTRTEQQNKG